MLSSHRASWPHLLVGALVALALQVAAGGSVAARPAPKPSATPSPREESDARASRSSRVLVVEGAAVDGVLWRGWPVLIQLVVPAGDALPAQMELRGVASVTPKRAANLWVIADRDSARMKTGPCKVEVAGVAATVRVEDPPSTLTADQIRTRRRLEVYAAIALGDLATAKRVATEWTQAEEASPDAQAALGDALYAAGDRAAAAKAYRDALLRIPAGVHPPGSLNKRARDLLLRPADAASPSASPAPSDR